MQKILVVARVDGSGKGMIEWLALVTKNIRGHRSSGGQKTRCIQRQRAVQSEERIKGTVLVVGIVAAVVLEAGRICVLAMSVIAVSNRADGRSVAIREAFTY